jgi:hypothetical protein
MPEKEHDVKLKEGDRRQWIGKMIDVIETKQQKELLGRPCLAKNIIPTTMGTKIELRKTHVVTNPCKICRLLTNPLDDHNAVARIKEETKGHGRQQPIHHDAVTP